MYDVIDEKNFKRFSLIFLPLYMLIHLVFMLSYMTELISDGVVPFSSFFIENVFRIYFSVGVVTYVLLGTFFWLKPKIVLPIFLLVYFLVQAPIMNGLNWHDQHVAYLTIIVMMLKMFKPEIEIRRWVLIFLSMFFWGAGLGKLYTGGFEWMDGYTAQYRFITYHVLFDAPGYWIANNFLLCKVISILTVAFELAFPLCLFIRRLEKPMVYTSLIFLTAIYITMKINFFMFLIPVYLIFLPWGKLEDFYLKLMVKNQIHNRKE